MEDAISAAGRSDGMAALLLIDLDGLKEVNDTLGHDHGDRLLMEVAQRLSQVLRRGDTLARLGGDEFAVLLAGVPNRAAVVELAARLQDALARPLGMTEDSDDAAIVRSTIASPATSASRSSPRASRPLRSCTTSPSCPATSRRASTSAAPAGGRAGRVVRRPRPGGRARRPAAYAVSVSLRGPGRKPSSISGSS
jgi:diguanylate cyclase (GGDEF)-like protein